MNTSALKNSPAFFPQDCGAHAVRVIKADQAAAFGVGEVRTSTEAAARPARKSAEVRLVGSGPDYCDLEITCGCGDVTRFRCWNTEEKVAAK